jgi:peptide-methionine (S)-S-oxide reductase
VYAAATAAEQAQAAPGDFVRVHYTGTLADGTEFDSSREREPLEFVIGAGKVIKGFDEAVTGLQEGESRKQHIEPESAYGQWNEGLTAKVPIADAPKGLKKGDRVQLSNGVPATIADVIEDHVVIDANHELAGKALNFDVELVKLYKMDQLEKATFGAGCFWGPELAFQRVPGVITTEVGYTNGQTEDPTYEEVCSGSTGHAEVVQVTYDSQEVSFKSLLDVFWKQHNPTHLNRQGGDTGTQYRSGIYVHNDEQKHIAEESMKEAQSNFKDPIVTEVAHISKYHSAEQYHQQYLASGGRFGRAQSTKKGCDDPIRCYG